MRYLVTGSQMREVDRFTMEDIGIPSMVLMERAALSVADEIIKRSNKQDRILALCGSGNNGADGIAAARILYLKGYKASVLLTGGRDKGTGEYLTQLKAAEALGMEIMDFSGHIPGKYKTVIDAVFGVGLSRDVEGKAREAIEAVNGMNPNLVAAVDIPSGIDADTGRIMGAAIKACVTVTFGYEKLGLKLYPGKALSGQVITADIGFPGEGLMRQKPGVFTYDREDLRKIPVRPAYSNKGTFGRVLIVAGSRNMSGAAYLSALAAYRTGAGLVRFFTVEDNRAVLQTCLPEAVITTYEPEEALALTGGFTALLGEACAWASAIVLGPGIGRERYVKNVVEQVLANAYVPMILDADGLNVIADHQELTGYFTENVIATPHLGEMSRLTGSAVSNIQSQLITTAREYADRFGITCVLKDAVTVAALRDGRSYVNASGNSAMAKAGAGDVLTGILAGLLALGMDETEAAALGVYLHGLAGDRVLELKGEHGLLARELAEAVPEVMNQVERKEISNHESI